MEEQPNSTYYCGMYRSGRLSIVVLLIVAILATGGTRFWADNYRSKVLNRGQVVIADSSQSLSNMSSYALALLLGGLRGPLVMMLWISSESQKADKNLQDFDTKVEWIRMLQPEFDSVHMFQIWNKAYNISVQMASLSNKYTTILDALDYADKVNRQRPNDINIIMAIADVYFNKLGNSTEKDYYRQRVTRETRWRPTLPTKDGSEEFRATRLPPMLDEKGDILPADQDTLKYLVPYEPFPYGLNPFAISYNYYRIAQHLQNDEHQQHLQISPSVIDSRPAIALENWSQEELDNGRNLEAALFNRTPAPGSQTPVDLETANIAVNTPMNPSVDVDRLVYCYSRAAQLGADAAKAYDEHLKSSDFNENNLFTYQWHSDHNSAISKLAGADRDYLKAMLASGAERQKKLSEAREGYLRAIRECRIVMYKWFTPSEALQQMHIEKMSVGNLSDADLANVSNELHHLMTIHAPGTMNGAEDRMDYERDVLRAQQRINEIGAAMAAAH
ncbi:MAG TPA: hypothetical protein VGG19_19275 [Tepidisphaeraceae bacterium]